MSVCVFKDLQTLFQLKDLLANAFDDIEADETCSFASDDSHDSGRHSDEIW